MAISPSTGRDHRARSADEKENAVFAGLTLFRR
jgi:hypothetical protein